MKKKLPSSEGQILQGTSLDLYDDGRTDFLPRYRIGQAQVSLSHATPARASEMTCRDDMVPHDHDYYEICLALDGRAVHCTRQNRAAFAVGSVTVLAPGDVHAFKEVQSLTVINVYYLTEWLLGELRSLWDQDGLVPLFLARSLFQHQGDTAPQWTLSPDERDLCARESQALIAEAQAPQPSLVYLKSALLKLLIVLGRAYQRTAPRETGFGFRREVRLALDYIESAVREAGAFSLEEMGRRTGRSGGHAARLFKSATGRSAQDYFQRRRAQHAALRLLTPDRSITEVAYEAGYADAAHFSRLFRRHLGLSPREYRQRHGRVADA